VLKLHYLPTHVHRHRAAGGLNGLILGILNNHLTCLIAHLLPPEDKIADLSFVITWAHFCARGLGSKGHKAH
jgi:hypothetical protein